MTRHKWADLIIEWAEGAEIQNNYVTNPDDIGWLDCGETPLWHCESLKFRRKPKEPDWWENIPEHGVLAESVLGKYVAVLKAKPNDVTEWIPLTNKEIERFKR